VDPTWNFCKTGPITTTLVWNLHEPGLPSVHLDEPVAAGTTRQPVSVCASVVVSRGCALNNVATRTTVHALMRVHTGTHTHTRGCSLGRIARNTAIMQSGREPEASVASTVACTLCRASPPLTPHCGIDTLQNTGGGRVGSSGRVRLLGVRQLEQDRECGKKQNHLSSNGGWHACMIVSLCVLNIDMGQSQPPPYVPGGLLQSELGKWTDHTNDGTCDAAHRDHQKGTRHQTYRSMWAPMSSRRCCLHTISGQR